MAGALVVAHSFLLVHPGITTIIQEYGAAFAMVLVYRIIIAIPTIVVAGIWFPKVSKKWIPSAFEKTGNAEAIGDQKPWKLEETPGFGISVFNSGISDSVDNNCSLFRYFPKTIGICPIIF